MVNFRKKVHCIFICVLTLTLTLTSITYANEDFKKFNNLDERLAYLKGIIQYIEKNYDGKVTEEELMEGAYKGVFKVLDPHSNYFEKDEYNQFQIDSIGAYGGIGATISVKAGKLIIVGFMENSPAKRAGLKEEDIIESINDEVVSKYNSKEGIDLLLGHPGTKVKLGIKRKGQESIQYFYVQREIIKINPVQFKVIDDHIGYIRIDEFNQNASENVKKSLEELKAKNIKGIILDLRGNLGGLLQEGVKVADEFIPKGPVVHINYKNKKRKTLYAEKEKINIPLVVLVNRLTASASEIVAGAIQDTKSGIIVGTKTYGKGTVQQTTPITNGGGIKLTIAEYLTPNERSINGIGIQPDVLVKNNLVVSKEVIGCFVSMIEDKKFSLGERGLNVYGAQQRLKLLGYEKVEATSILDGVTLNALKDFQKINGLEETGVLDLKTRDKINERMQDLSSGKLKDLQLEKAIEILKE
ncbi:S41 family peptidase [Crassaminicella profunda]|uniref:S41 family peptidase n=1 Tax=Crassaminicella profunda TaxID=1286698 RepID=UPI001CA73C01|nr:S41 family peptidase [Crassaminicella profunda]QZY55486.1 S41 family peptidase [Crassaminicella profunda]